MTVPHNGYVTRSSKLIAIYRVTIDVEFRAALNMKLMNNYNHKHKHVTYMTRYSKI